MLYLCSYSNSRLSDKKKPNLSFARKYYTFNDIQTYFRCKGLNSSKVSLLVAHTTDIGINISKEMYQRRNANQNAQFLVEKKTRCMGSLQYLCVFWSSRFLFCEILFIEYLNLKIYFFKNWKRFELKRKKEMCLKINILVPVIFGTQLTSNFNKRLLNSLRLP